MILGRARKGENCWLKMIEIIVKNISKNQFKSVGWGMELFLNSSLALNLLYLFL
jgi:hypothetical protein